MTKQDAEQQLPVLLEQLRAWVDGRQLEGHIISANNDLAILHSGGQARDASIAPEDLDSVEPPEPTVRRKVQKQVKSGNRRAFIGFHLQRALRAIVREYPEVTAGEIRAHVAESMPPVAGPKAGRQLPPGLVYEVIEARLRAGKSPNRTKAFLWLSREIGRNVRTLQRVYQKAR